ncbi:MAG: molecular chaperone TorD family protein [Betaproteobacteria bacterium]|nr:molecular chaperone TorD family protein [Betaproteobacteria bacterium]
MLNAILAIDGPQRRPVAEEPHASPDEQRQECLARAASYRLLGGVFAEEPGRAFLQALRNEETLAALAEAGVRFDADFTATDPDTLLDRLSCEYTDLFVVSGGFPPVESVRLTGRYQQEPHHLVKQTYRRLGFEVVKGRFEVFPDQLGVELLFVAALLERCAAALESGDAQQFRRLDKEIKRFWTQHLGKWVRGYCRLVERATEHSFYREMARYLNAFAEEEIAAMGLRIDDADQGRMVVPKQEVSVAVNPDEPVCNGCTPGRPDGAPARASVHPLQDLR